MSAFAAKGNETVSLKFDGYIAVLFVQDLSRARDFYQNVMGLELQYSDDESGAVKIDPDTLLILDHTGADALLSPADVNHQPARGARFRPGHRRRER